jgi:hypothetical protein
MVSMFMSNENCFHTRDCQSKPGHSSLGLATGNPGINQHRIMAIANKIAVSVASGIECGEV